MLDSKSICVLQLGSEDELSEYGDGDGETGLSLWHELRSVT